MNVTREHVIVGDGRSDQDRGSGLWLLALIIILFLIGVGWAVNNGSTHARETTRDMHGHSNTVMNLLVGSQLAQGNQIAEIKALVGATYSNSEFARDAIIQNRGEMSAGFQAARVDTLVGVQSVNSVTQDAILRQTLFGVTQGYQPAARVFPDPCCSSGRGGYNGNDVIVGTGNVASQTRTATGVLGNASAG